MNGIKGYISIRGGVLPLWRVGAAGQSVLRRGADLWRVPVRAFMGDSGKCGKAVRPVLLGTAQIGRAHV